MNTQEQQTAIAAIHIYSTVKQFCERHQAFTQGGIRHNIFNEATNGLKESRAIVRNGRPAILNLGFSDKISSISHSNKTYK